LLAASFIPQGQRDLQDLTRYRTKLVQERSRAVNWVQGVLERANIKLASVATDVMEVSGRAILAALIAEQALTGLVRDHHRRLLALQLALIDFWTSRSIRSVVRSRAAWGSWRQIARPRPTWLAPRVRWHPRGMEMLLALPCPLRRQLPCWISSPGMD
jgi:hypothetical protein